ncbi:MAG TPA: hypothetical protein VGD24_01360 [Gallionella sp.]
MGLRELHAFFFRTYLLESKEMTDTCSRPSSDDPEGNACLMAVLGTTALTAIVSGSLIVAGNTVYWLEKEARCIAKTNSNIGNETGQLELA